MALLKNTKSTFLTFYQNNELLVSIFVFVLGFLFDILTIGRIDDLFNFIQQTSYLIILGTLLIIEIKIKLGFISLNEKWQKIWNYHNLIVHFLFGSLLSIYTIFYYTSASATVSFVFLALLAMLLIANESQRFRKTGLKVRVILFSICSLSYFLFLYPILFNHVGRLQFFLGIISSFFVMLVILKINFKDKTYFINLAREVLIPIVSVHILFICAYFFNMIPPVPLAVKKIGIYYEVEKKDGLYIGKYLHQHYKFWHKGSQDFIARPDDKIMVLMSIFSPAKFEDKIFVKWYFIDPLRGKILEDTIPLTILGGRENGFRGFASKINYRKGPWLVSIETTHDQVVGQIRVHITEDNELTPRDFVEDKF